MGSVMSYINYVYVKTHEGKSLTVNTDKQADHCNDAGQSSMSVVGHLEQVWGPLGEESLTVMTVCAEQTVEGMTVRQRCSSNEIDFASVAGVETSADPEASSDHETLKEPNAPSFCVADPECMPVSMQSSSD